MEGSFWEVFEVGSVWLQIREDETWRDRSRELKEVDMVSFQKLEERLELKS